MMRATFLMRRVVVAAVFLAVVTWTWALTDQGAVGVANEAVPEELVLSFTPEAAPERLELDAQGLADFLAAELGIPVSWQLDADYTATVEAMRFGHAHIATNLAPLQAARAHEVAGAELILAEERGGRAYYRSRFWVLADSGIETLQDLEGRIVAFNDPLSGSGYLMPVATLIRDGIIEGGEEIHRFFGTVYFAGGTELSIRALMNGFVDAAAVSEHAAEIFLSPEDQERITYIAESDPLPRHVIGVAGQLPPELVEQIKQAFLKLNEPEYNHILQGLYGWRRVVPVANDLYLPLIPMAVEVGILDR